YCATETGDFHGYADQSAEREFRRRPAARARGHAGGGRRRLQECHHQPAGLRGRARPADGRGRGRGRAQGRPAVRIPTGGQRRDDAGRCRALRRAAGHTAATRAGLLSYRYEVYRAVSCGHGAAGLTGPAATSRAASIRRPQGGKFMFKKILIPTDGSPLSAQAANAGVSFARSIGAEVVALHVTQPFAATIGFDGMAAAYAITDEAYEEAAQEQAAKYLKSVMDRAETAGVQGKSYAVSN